MHLNHYLGRFTNVTATEYFLKNLDRYWFGGLGLGEGTVDAFQWFLKRKQALCPQTYKLSLRNITWS